MKKIKGIGNADRRLMDCGVLIQEVLEEKDARLWMYMDVGPQVPLASRFG